MLFIIDLMIPHNGMNSINVFVCLFPFILQYITEEIGEKIKVIKYF